MFPCGRRYAASDNGLMIEENDDYLYYEQSLQPKIRLIDGANELHLVRKDTNDTG